MDCSGKTDICDYLWKPLEFFQKDVKILLVILNQPIKSMQFFEILWKKASFKACCDGAGNRLDEISPCSQFIPDMIGGDGDSITDNVKEKFSGLGREFVSLYDQNATDFTKCLLYSLKVCKESNVQFDMIVAYPAIGGRLDHTLSNINTLFFVEKESGKPCYLLSDDDVVCLLPPGKSKIMTNTGAEGEWCGLMPIGETASHVTTTGLKYNVEDCELRFGGLVSSSNSVTSDRITVSSDSHLLFTLGYKLP